MHHEYIVLDVFTDTPLAGNQLAVFTDGGDLATARMQQTARELNLSETVFLLPGEDGADAIARIFTPTAELPFAGHPVLGTAFVVGERLATSVVRLKTGAGIVRIDLTRDDGKIVFAEMEQPIPTAEPFPLVGELLAALGAERSELPVEAYCNGPLHVYVDLGSAPAVSALEPDLTAVARLGVLGVSCFAASAAKVKTRMFAPALGVPEDPATGSAAGPLALHLARHGRIEFGQQIEIRQGEEIARPSVLYARAEGTAEKIERVIVAGAAVVVARGHYRLS